MSIYIPTWDEAADVAQSRGQLSDNPELWRGLVGLWPMQEMAGDRLYDFSPYGFNFTPEAADSAYSVTRGTDIIGGTVAFGTNTAINFPAAHPLNGLTYTENLTISVWCEYPPTTNRNTQWDFQCGGILGYFWLRQNSNSIYARIVGTDTSEAVISDAGFVGQFLHCVLVYENSTSSLWVNGTLRDVAGSAVTGDGTWGNRFYMVVGDALALGSVYRRALADREITRLYRDPWTLLRRRRRRAVAIGGGAAAYILSAESGSYAVSGTAGTLQHDRLLSVGAGSYALSGTAAGINLGFILSVGAGSYGVAGTSPALTADRKLIASAGAYSLAGTATSLVVDRSISVQPGSYAITGTSSSLLVDRTLSVGAGSYSVTGAGIGLQHDRQLTAGAGAYSVAGTDANLIYSGAGSYALTALPGIYSITGGSADLRADRQLVAQSGSYSLAGAAADLLMSRMVVANPGTYVVTGSLVDLSHVTGPALPMEIGGVQLRAVLATECELRSALSMDCELKQSLEMEGALI